MSPFVLMLFIVGAGGYSGQTGLAMHEFDTKHSCEAAGAAAVAKWTERAQWTCVPKLKTPSN
jgi:hypothetical protein